ncbi:MULTISPECIES: flagellar motor protein MotB [unclassified Pseudomonas]|uniref:flagellar motor protein MotB n=1 Tax=unclassified Pseudomonas TaxID=196821 RepID=UPI000BDDA8A0|nr:MULTISPECIES: flagellar motor protein MotB [unclassified Pseudomonas]PVZ15466.1 chemotaxis protein MotB [Pseudomonas sp. URIL14HWK12:I12]PVZ24840.1 chemotaxis protein MotB [Pseudomonas sp. URIL14HWK12:I10]PVZ34686.1 chemotaxis protein MotB [Pseudomonas sp. URIL14HWK12:I11]SNZ08963.1 chemotaxis protein MotB [Pseudomonas sp. URIL14HWK12:I9]
MENNQPIIVKRVKRFGGGHHGGAWKIAFADFATAMMAFFLVLWLLSNATPEQKIAIAGYFKDPIGFTESGSPYVIDLGGSPQLSPDATLNPETKESPPKPETDTQSQVNTEQAENIAEKVEKDRLELLLQELQNKVDENPQLAKFKDQILFEITQDGLRIQIMDAENRPMFDLGSARLKPYFEDLLLAMADTIKEVPNKISISGHTDAKPYASTGDFGNWELSASRANAARRTLVAGSYPENQVARVVGFGSSALFDRKNPLNPVNRRIDITVLTKKAERAIEGDANQDEAKPAAPDQAAPGAAPSGAPQGSAAPSNQPVQPRDLREKMNIFDNGALQMQGNGNGNGNPGTGKQL